MSTSRFLAGALVGLVAGLLLAPEKGEDMREEIADTASKWKKKIDKMAGRTGAQVQDLTKILSDQVEGLNNDVRERLLNIIDQSTDKAAEMKEHLKSKLS